MRELKSIVAVVALLLGAVSCQSDEEQSPTVSAPVINTRNMEGVWMLQEIEGIDLDDDIYLYIALVHEDLSFDMYDNFDSAYSHQSVGTFVIDEDDNGRKYINGYYTSNFSEEWSEYYYIEDFTLESMTWVGAESGSIQRFVLVDEIPSDIVAGTRSAEF
ncbi:MAG: hypothetical protein SNI51_01165 [Rikenellaceae bacterium]